MAHRIWPGTRALAQLHLDQGQRVWLVTAAPIEIATIIARRLGLTGALGTVAEHVDGVYTGALVGEMLHGSAKAVAVKELADRFGLDLARCSAYSDSYNDLPMLSEVGDPSPSTPTTGCVSTPEPTAGGSATTAPAARPLGPACSPPRWPGRSPAPWPPGAAIRRKVDLTPVAARAPASALTRSSDVGWVTIWFTRAELPRNITEVGGQPADVGGEFMGEQDLQRGLDALRRALAEVLDPATLVPDPRPAPRSRLPPAPDRAPPRGC